MITCADNRAKLSIVTMNTVFPYPGGKTYLADWIIDHFPEHECYVEVFGGGGSVLVNKDPSFNEVYNDLDDDLTHFFRVLRENHTELREWLERVPFGRSQHQEFKEAFYNGERPDDDVERAGRFFYLRYSQHSAKYRTPSGFAAAQQRNKARKLRNATDQLEMFANRFSDVTIESLDFADLIDLYDSDDTLFYCDPPYVDEGDALYSHEGAFDHERFVSALNGVEGDWIVSYMDLPPGLEDYYVVDREASQFMNKSHDERREKATERLVMNYDPDEVPSFAGADQSNLEAFGD
jgi:DNA adenine methylase